MSVNDTQLKQAVWKILVGMPIQVFDEETHSVWENDLWELVSPRAQDEGDYAGSRIIGSANIVVAFNIVRVQLIDKPIDDIESYSMELYKQLLEQLQQEKLIRKKPHKVRQSFKLV
jgi:hypothetical protein